MFGVSIEMLGKTSKVEQKLNTLEMFGPLIEMGKMFDMPIEMVKISIDTM